MAELTFVRRRRRLSREQGTTLVELLVVMVIMSIVTAMIMVTWFALQSAYSSTTIATKQRETAQQAMSRMVQEIRDTSGTVGTAAGKGIFEAEANKFSSYSAFNDQSASEVKTDGTGDGVDPDTGAGYRPPLGGFYYEDGTLYRWRDLNGDEVRTTADRVDVLATHVVNDAIFWYTCIDPSTGEVSHTDLVGPTELGTITSVQITLRIDLNPGHSPTYMDLISTAQPRNNRQT